MSESTRFMSIDAAAERLSVSPDSVRRWIESGEVPAIRIGNLWRIPHRFFVHLEQQAMAEKAAAPAPASADAGGANG